MINNYLLIVEGEKTEPELFSRILESYGFHVEIAKEKHDVNLPFEVSLKNASKDKINVLIAQFKQNRIHDFMIKFNKSEEDLGRYFNMEPNYFKAIFLIFDVDHNERKDLEECMNKFNDESSGLLLISSPCIEVLADDKFFLEDRCETYYHIKKDYVSKINDCCNKNNKCNALEFIASNFHSLALSFLKKNRDDFDENNIMEHPYKVVEKINELNIRKNWKDENDERRSELIYRYFTTVIYVFIAYIHGLTSKIDNYSLVYDFFNERSHEDK